MRFRSAALIAAAAATCLFLSPSAYAQDTAESDDVSPQVDLTLWCGAYYGIIQQVAVDDPAKQALAKEYGGQAYTKAGQAMLDDGIEASEHERLINFYIDMAITEVKSPEDDNRYTDDECFALITP